MVTDKKLKKAAYILIVLLIIMVLEQIFSSIGAELSDLVSVLAPFLLALIAAYILDPVTDWLETHGLSRNIAILIQVFALLIIITVLGIIIIPNLVHEIIQLINSLPDIINSIYFFIRNRVKIPAIQEFINNLSSENLKQYVPQATKIIQQLTAKVFAQFLQLIRLILNILLFLVASFYFLKEFDSMKDTVLGLIPEQKRKLIFPMLNEIDSLLKSFFRGQFIIINILAALNVIGLSIIGLNFAFAVGILAGYLNILPYFGSITGVFFSLILAFVQFGDFIHLIYVASVFAVVQALDAYLITPKIQGKNTGLSPIIIIFSVLFFGYLFGFLGLLLAIPVAVILKVIIGYYVEQYRHSGWYKSKS